MPKYTTDELEQLIAAYPLADFVESDAGQQPSKSGKWRMFKCPIHNGDDKNFGVNTETNCATCFSHGCVEGANIFGYIMAREGCTFPEAVQKLESKTPLSKLDNPPKREPQKVEVPQEKYLSRIYDLLQYQSLKSVTKFLENRAIDPCLMNFYHITADTKYYATSYGDEIYKFKSGREFKLTIPRIIFPNLFFGKVRYVQSRRYDSAIQAMFDEEPEPFYEMLVEMIEGGDEDATLDDVFNHLSKRYKIWPKPHISIYNPHRIVTKRNGQYYYPEWSYLIVCEGEIDVLSLESAGYPAVGFRSSSNLYETLTKRNNIKSLFIVAENDKPKLNIRTGKWHVAGEDWADRIAFGSKHENVKIIHPPKEYKDANDVAKAGKLKEWLSIYGIAPVDRKILMQTLEMSKNTE